MELIGMNDLCKLLGVARSTFHRQVRYSKGFPLAVRIGGQLKWFKSEVEEWCAEIAPRSR